MSTFGDITALVSASGITVYDGYPPSGAKLPYVAHRPFYTSVAEGENPRNLDGSAVAFDHQSTLYACAGSVEASYNLAMLLMAFDGVYMGNTTLSTSMGYSGAQVEGHYESQVTVQLNQGGI